jgi:hypothetical protein
MLSFATEFPVSRTHGPQEFIASVKEWILGSPHTDFRESDFADVPSTGEWRLIKDAERIRMLRVSTVNEEVAAVEYLKIDRDLEWSTVIVFSRQEADAWIGTRISCEANHPATRVPLAKKPVYIRMFLESLEGALDGEIFVGQEPHSLDSDQLALAARLIFGSAGCRLPVVYVSCDFQGGHAVDVNALANDLSGMAHVVVEPDRRFSRRLQIETQSDNVYGGAVGIYWPQGGGRRSLFNRHEFEKSADIKRAIFEEVRAALMNRRALVRCTWSYAQETASREDIKSLRASGSSELDKFMEAFDSESEARDKQLAEAEEEITRLTAEIQEHERQFTTGVGMVRLRTGAEHDLYAGELAEIVRDAIEEAVNRVQPDSRRQHVLQAILKASLPNENAEGFRSELKQLLRNYRRMDARTRRGLEAIGFTIEEEGKHHKLTFGEDDRYTFSLPKSGGDHRGGLNAAGDISKRLF